MAAKQRYELWVGILLAAAMALLAWMAVMVGAVGGLGPQIHVSVKMKDAAGIGAGASVMVYGVEVGRVERMELQVDGAVAHASIQAGVGLLSNVKPLIRARSVLGEKYLELKPVAEPAEPLADGAELMVEFEQTEIDEIVSQSGQVLGAFDAKALGEALKLVSKELAEDPQRLQRAFSNLEIILENTAEASKGLPAMVAHAESTLTKADALLDEGAGMVRDARSAMASAEEAIAAARPAIDKSPKLMEDMSVAVADAREAMDKVSTLADNTNKLLDEFDGVSEDLKEILANFSEIDKWELRRLLREEGILVRLKPEEVVPSDTRTEEVVPPARQHP